MLPPFVSYDEIDLHVRVMGKIVYWPSEGHFGLFFFFPKTVIAALL